MLTTVEKIKVIMKRNNFTMTELANQLNRETGEKIEL